MSTQFIKLNRPNAEHVWIAAAHILFVEPFEAGSRVYLAAPGQSWTDGPSGSSEPYRLAVTQPPGVIAALVCPTTTFREAARRLEEAVAAS